MDEKKILLYIQTIINLKARKVYVAIRIADEVGFKNLK